jgi:hypothetical protein
MMAQRHACLSLAYVLYISVASPAAAPSSAYVSYLPWAIPAATSSSAFWRISSCTRFFSTIES